MDNHTRLIRIGGYGALAVALTQVVGNALHPPMPLGTVDSIHTIQQHQALWQPVHLLITVSYFLFIPFGIGLAASFRKGGPLIKVGTPLVLVGAGLGVVQILTHLALFYPLAMDYGTGTGPLTAVIVATYGWFWKYSVALEVTHLLAIFLTATLFGTEMLKEPQFKRWIAILGIVGGIVAAAGIIVGKFVIVGRTGDLIFGFGLLPAVIWIVASGITLLRMKPAPEPQRIVAPPAPTPATATASVG